MIRMQKTLNARRGVLRDSDKGFTLIELLVVVIIIGILAAIAVPIYIGVQDNAKDSAVKSDLANAKIAVVAYFTEKNAYPTDLTGLSNYGYTVPAAGGYAASGLPALTLDTSKKVFCIGATSVTTKKFAASDNGNVAAGTCSAGVFTATP